MNISQKIRNQIRAARKRLEPAGVDAASAAAQRKIFDLPEWQKAGNVCCYLAMPQEIQTDLIVARCHVEKKRVFVPAWRPARRKYMLACLGPEDDVQLGRFNVLEPIDPDWTSGDKIDLVLVPGLAFDPSGGRLGHGGGYYDDLLSRPELKSAFKAGLAFDFQIFKKLPLHAKDVRMNAVITESEIYRC